jgi:hypothetical protein
MLYVLDTCGIVNKITLNPLIQVPPPPILRKQDPVFTLVKVIYTETAYCMVNENDNCKQKCNFTLCAPWILHIIYYSKLVLKFLISHISREQI